MPLVVIVAEMELCGALADLDYCQKLKEKYDVCLFASTKATLDNPNFKQVLKNKDTKSVLIVVGPEGGISPKEEDLMEQTGFLPITLGTRILRTELAPVYIMSAISYETELGE